MSSRRKETSPIILTLDPPTRQQPQSLDALQIATNDLLAGIGLGQGHLLHREQVPKALHGGDDAFVVGGWAAVLGSRGTGGRWYNRGCLSCEVH